MIFQVFIENILNYARETDYPTPVGEVKGNKNIHTYLENQ
jgi:hypothetical protein